MAKHNMAKAKERHFLENIALNLSLAEIEESLEGNNMHESEMVAEKKNASEKGGFRPYSDYPYYVFIDGMNDGALTLSANRKILYCNKAFAQMLHSTAEILVGMDLGHFVDSVGIARIDEIMELSEIPKTTVDISCQPANGAQPVLLRLSANPLPMANTDGNVFFIAYDISGFKLIEEEFRQAQNISEKHIAERTSKLISANEDLVSSRIATLSMMEDTVEAKNNLEITNKKLVEEIIERKRSELVQQVLFSISNAVLITNVLEDLIAIIQTELGKLLETKNFYVAFYDEVSDTLTTPYIQDEKDSISTWSAANSLTGYMIKSGKELIIKRNEIHELIKAGAFELVGTIAEVWLGVPLEVDGKMIGAIVVQNYDNADAFDSKDLEMLKFISHQISISIQRKKAVHNLTKALVKAEESDRLKTAFLQNVSHEIRTPMNAILGFSDLLNEQDLDPDTRKNYTEIIRKSGNHLLTILEDIINISELEAGMEVLRSGRTSLNPMLRDMYEQYKLKAGKKHIEIELLTGLSDEQANIITDETKLIQIISNLLNNSLKFTRQGSICFGYKMANKNLEFFVKDTGVGIPRDKYNDIFDRFKQVEVVLSNENGGRGLGLGLSISKAYTELLGGKIWLDSEPGKGSEFYFSIPYVPVTKYDKPERLLSGAEPGNALNMKTILVAESVKRNYLLVSELFAGMNANILWVRNGLEALQACKSVGKIDMVIMDVEMAKMGGMEAARLMRVFLPKLPLIAQSFNTSKKEQKDALMSGFSEYLSGPLETSQIIGFANQYLDNYFNMYNTQNLAS
jgi:signal transduction histidine kinase/CheY-like chemotaxis protein/PAS domain-containing protein